MINFEINLIFLIKLFFLQDQKAKNSNILITKRAFKIKQKTFFLIIFQGLLVVKNCLRPETAPLTMLAIKRGLLCNFAKPLTGRHFYGT